MQGFDECGKGRKGEIADCLISGYGDSTANAAGGRFWEACI